MALPAPSPTFVAFREFAFELQRRIVAAVEVVDGGRFEAKDWTRPEGGGGRMMTLRGAVVEKGAVHVSDVHGATNPLTGNAFRAVGCSVIVHPADPHAPTAHLNVRCFEEPGGGWCGAGADLTPMGVHHPEDAAFFHDVLRKALGARYDEGKAEADRYFHVPHRGRARGAGGVFYDHVPLAEGLPLARAVGEAFLDAYPALLAKRGRQPFTEADREKQLVERGVYVEFNLLYDRGTRFGFQSGGNVEAILSSLPPLVRW